jgi:hypothetical protein
MLRTRAYGPRGAPRNSITHCETQAILQTYVDRFPDMPAHRRATLWTYLILTQLAADSQATLDNHNRHSDIGGA